MKKQPNKKTEEELTDVVFDESETDIASKIKKLQKKLKECQKEKQEYLDGWQRSKADYVNSKKEQEDNRSRVYTLCRTEMVESLLPVLDSFDMAFANKENWEAVDKNWRVGVEYIHSQLISTLDQYEVSPIGEVGEEFDPNLHHSVETVEVEGVSQDHKILEVLQRGYKMKEDVIRPARVKVANAK